MTTPKQSTSTKTLAKFVIGCFIIVLGITLILAWSDEIVILFRGTIGFILAGSGLLLLYSLKK